MPGKGTTGSLEVWQPAFLLQALGFPLGTQHSWAYVGAAASPMASVPSLSQRRRKPLGMRSPVWSILPATLSVWRHRVAMSQVCLHRSWRPSKRQQAGQPQRAPSPALSSQWATGMAGAERSGTGVQRRGAAAPAFLLLVSWKLFRPEGSWPWGSSEEESQPLWGWQLQCAGKSCQDTRGPARSGSQRPLALPHGPQVIETLGALPAKWRWHWASDQT